MELPKRTQPGPHPVTDDGVLNAYWSKGDLILVIPDADSANGVRFRRLRAEHSCFVKRADIPDPEALYRMLINHPQVRKAEWEGDREQWLRICWQNRDAVKHYCKVFASTTKADGSEKVAIPTYEGVISPVLRYMVDNEMRPSTPRRIWVDLETDSRVSFGEAAEGRTRILSWATEDEFGVKAHGLLNEDTDEDELRLLLELWAQFERYDQILAWNGDRFDFPVIKGRSEHHQLLRPSERDWRRWLWLDHLSLYRRMNMSAAESGDEKTSFKLGDVAQAILGEGKDDFDASKTWEAWAAGGAERRRLLKYNIKDTALMPAIEKKTGFVALLQTVSDTCGTFPDSRGSNPGVQVEGFLARLAHETGHKFPTVLKMSIGEKYEGAYVMHPEKNAGVHRDVHVADFASLYPTIICTWNMSPETIIDDPASYEGPKAYSPLTNQYFAADYDGILPIAVSKLMDLRKSWNDKKASLPPGTEAWKDADRRSSAFKITANSFYGVIGAPTSRHYDRRVAESVTQCGKWLIQETMKAAEDRGMKIVYGDTDSIFVVNAPKEKFETFVKWCNLALYPRILEELGAPNNRIKLAYEKQFDRLIFTTAKRYVGNYVHYKGSAADATSKPEIKGLEFKRGDSIRLTRRFQEQVAHMLVNYQCDPSHDPDNPELFEAKCAEWLDHVMENELPLDDILLSKRLNKSLEDYKVETPMVRIAKAMDARGEDVGEGAKIAYVVVDASVSPQEVIPAHEYELGVTQINRMALWDKLIWPPTQRLLEAAFPGHSWMRFTDLIKAKKKAETMRKRRAKEAEKLAAREAKQAERDRKKAEKEAEKQRKLEERARKKAEKAASKAAPPRKKKKTTPQG